MSSSDDHALFSTTASYWQHGPGDFTLLSTPVTRDMVMKSNLIEDQRKHNASFSLVPTDLQFLNKGEKKSYVQVSKTKDTLSLPLLIWKLLTIEVKLSVSGWLLQSRPMPWHIQHGHDVACPILYVTITLANTELYYCQIFLSSQKDPLTFYTHENIFRHLSKPT